MAKKSDKHGVGLDALEAKWAAQERLNLAVAEYDLADLDTSARPR